MKCPLMLMSWQETSILRSFAPFDCLKKDCAQYDKKRKQCNEISKVEALREIAKALGRYKGN